MRNFKRELEKQVKEGKIFEDTSTLRGEVVTFFYHRIWTLSLKVYPRLGTS